MSLGGLRKVLNLDDKEIQEVSRFAVTEVARRDTSIKSNGANLVAAWTQVVAGLKYVLQYDLGDGRKMKVEVLRPPGVKTDYQMLNFYFL